MGKEIDPIQPVVPVTARWPESAFWGVREIRRWSGEFGSAGVEVLPSWGLLATVRQDGGEAILTASDMVHGTYWADRGLERFGLAHKVRNALPTLLTLPKIFGANRVTWALAAETVQVSTHWPHLVPERLNERAWVLSQKSVKFNQAGEHWRRRQVVGKLPPRLVAEIHPGILLTAEQMERWLEVGRDKRGIGLPVGADVRYEESRGHQEMFGSKADAWDTFGALVGRAEVLYWKLPAGEKERGEVVTAVRDGGLSSPIAQELRERIQRVQRERNSSKPPLKIVLNFGVVQKEFLGSAVELLGRL